MADDTVMKVNTQTLRNNSIRLKNVNTRISTLNTRINNLYATTGIRELSGIISTNGVSGYQKHVSDCEKYLSEAAALLEKVENDVNKLF